ncbi:MAG: sulfatase-like hydrolase/transferase [Candidatus Poribacteria bacterium]|nr:sulfatase-like hydrolase/transferase [Candidatus Poribacteria bacterium]
MDRIRKFLLISIDCWRYDALSRTNARFNTPKFDLLTQDFSLAERFFVTAPATRPSHTSLFTGLYPFEHGLYGQTYLKMFAGLPNLFQLFADAGAEVMGRSERPDVFRFLDFESFITPIDPRAKAQYLGSLEDLIAWMDHPSATRQFGFIHFWYTHGGYGLGGIRSAPNLRDWVDQGRAEEALRFYYAAVSHVLEFSLVEILKRASLDEWAIFILGDHGEGFCEEIMAHGDTLHQNVLHVPLLAHIPGRGKIEFPEGPVSMIDLFPTITKLAGIDVDYRGYGANLLGSPHAFENRWVLSELDSLYGIGFLTPSNLQTDSSRVTSRVSMDRVEIEKYPDGVRLWSITDGQQLYRENEATGDFVRRDVMSGEGLPCHTPDEFRSIYNAIRANSNYQNPEKQEASTEEAAILEARLRDLGYIE